MISEKELEGAISEMTKQLKNRGLDAAAKVKMAEAKRVLEFVRDGK